MKGRVLLVAGSDSGGGAGIQADIKTVTALNGFAMTAITALTAQNTMGVHSVSPVGIDLIETQMRVVLDDLGADCLKTGMLYSSEVIETVCDVMHANGTGIPVIVDPVMVAKGGAKLLESDAVSAIRSQLLPIARVITPNIPEAETLLDMEIGTIDAMKQAAELIVEMGAAAVLLKGGHMSGRNLTDVLLDESGFYLFETERVDTLHTHGTGCSIASAIAVGIAQGLALPDAVRRAQAYVAAAIRSAPGYGGGHGPINHSHTFSQFDVK